MARLIMSPSIIEAAGNKPKIIEEFVGRVNSKDEAMSVAKMTSPSGWVEPGQTPEFREITYVLKGELQVKTKKATIKVQAGQAIVAEAGEWIQYSTPGEQGAEYIAICTPAFSIDTVHRDE